MPHASSTTATSTSWSLRTRRHSSRSRQQVGGVVVDNQHFAAGFGELTQRAEPVDAGNVDGDHQIGVAAHAAPAG